MRWGRESRKEAAAIVWTTVAQPRQAEEAEGPLALRIRQVRREERCREGPSQRRAAGGWKEPFVPSISDPTRQVLASVSLFDTRGN